MKTIKKAVALIVSRLFSLDSIILFKMDKPNLISSPAKVQKASIDNIKDILAFQDEKYLTTFKDFMKKGDIGYLGYIDGKCIHRSWVIINQGSIYNLHPFIKAQLKENQAYIHYCETAPSARGKNVYPFIISEIAKEFPDKEVLICVNKKNIPSIKGVLKAGFKPVRSIGVYRIFGLVFKREEKLKGEFF